MSQQQPKIQVSIVPELKATTGQKWLYALFAGILFAIISSPFVYSLTNQIFTAISPNLNTIELGGKPTLFGLILHAVVFALIIRLILW
jgi:hypothetical protein